MISLEKIKIMLAITGFILFLTSFAIPVNQSLAQQHRLVKPEWVMPEGYPDWFHGWGRIGYIDEDVVVINDFEYPLSPYVEFHTPTSPTYAYRGSFVPGVMAGFLFNSEDEVISLWMITMDD